MLVSRWQAPVVPNCEQAELILEREGVKPFKEEISKNVKKNKIRSPFTEIFLIVEGELVVDVSGNKLLLRKGDKITLPSNTTFSLETNEYDTLLLRARKIS